MRPYRNPQDANISVIHISRPSQVMYCMQVARGAIARHLEHIHNLYRFDSLYQPRQSDGGHLL